MLPVRNNVIVLVSKLHKPTLRALAFARATRPDTLTALTVNVDDADTQHLLDQWARRDLPVKLTVLESPFREITGAGGELRQEAAGRTSQRPGQRVHPRVRGRALVGEPAAQPVRAAPEGPAAVPEQRDGDQRAVAARLVAGPYRRRRWRAADVAADAAGRPPRGAGRPAVRRAAPPRTTLPAARR